MDRIRQKINEEMEKKREEQRQKDIIEEKKKQEIDRAREEYRQKEL